MLNIDEKKAAKEKAKRIKWLKKNIASYRRYDLLYQAERYEEELAKLQATI